MKTVKIAAVIHLSILAGLLSFSLSLPLSAYHQGSFFVIDLLKDADATKEGIAGRKTIAASIFKTETAHPQSEIASGKPPKTSEFESGIRSFIGGQTSASAASDLEILSLENETISSESSFGEDPPAPSGFFFTY